LYRYAAAEVKEVEAAIVAVRNDKAGPGCTAILSNAVDP
jgi:hypothetical protein